MARLLLDEGILRFFIEKVKVQSKTWRRPMRKTLTNILFLLILTLTQATSKNIEQRKVMVFGVFDLLHAGHHHFLKEASNFGHLIIVVTRDCIIEKLKKSIPLENEIIRLNKLKENFDGALVVLGDTILSDYSIIKHYKPDIICLGYDQQKLGDDIESQIKKGNLPNLTLAYLEPYHPTEYHTSIIRKSLTGA